MLAGFGPQQVKECGHTTSKLTKKKLLIGLGQPKSCLVPLRK